MSQDFVGSGFITLEHHQDGRFEKEPKIRDCPIFTSCLNHLSIQLLSLLRNKTNALDTILYKLRCYKDPPRVRRDALDCISRYPSLVPQSSAAPNSPPNSGSVLSLSGTVPITYARNNYNIPVVIWITESYPFGPASVWVTPTADMVIKPRHKHVDSQGIVYLPYLSSWNANTCNIISLVEVMIVVFSQDPPVRSTTARPQQPAAQPTQTPNYATTNAYPPKLNTSGNDPGGNGGYSNGSNSFLGNSYPPAPANGNGAPYNSGYPNSYVGYPNQPNRPEPSLAGSYGSVLPNQGYVAPSNNGYSGYTSPVGNSAYQNNGNGPSPQNLSNSNPNLSNSYSNGYPSQAYPPNNGNSYNYNPSSSSYSQGEFPPQQPPYTQPPNYNAPSPQPSRTNFYATSQTGEAGNRRETLENLTLKTQGRLHEFYTQTTKEIDGLIQGTDEDLKGHEQRKRMSYDKMAEMDREIMNLNKQMEDVDRWLAANNHSEGIDIDTITDFQDPLLKQLLDHVTDDSTLEDLMYNLEKALYRGTIEIDTCLKQVRLLAVEQCSHRALIKKIQDRRMAANGQK
ncbi:hypothetical protein PROFUN_06744 [Planoprotostelium fungivorum]|uniref:Tumor susceptibility protein n=1 Tax=Planoprotostelium fungivorum TaxID=1890364 RepID=A0A2P6NNJ5_9EUKA|nr:hypothetical protein PROFUN_06744 [Planoprotostelium fungivorum]